MLESYNAAPRSLRRLSVVSTIFLLMQFIAFMFYGYEMYRELSAALLVYDPFNPTSLTFKPEGFTLFLAGFATSMASGFAGFAALLALRTLKPYRGRSRSYALLLTVMQLLLLLVSCYAVLAGGREVDLRFLGTLSSIIIAPFVLVLLNSSSAKIWCKPLPPPTPPLPPGS